MGGGTVIHVNQNDGTVQVGPDSVAYRLVHEALAFRGETITSTDVALAVGLARDVCSLLKFTNKRVLFLLLSTDRKHTCQHFIINH